MEIILILVSTAGGAAVGLLLKTGNAFAIRLARIYIGLVLFLSAELGVFYFAGIKNQFLNGLLAGIASMGKYPARLLLGYLASVIFISLKNMQENTDIKKLIRLTLTGVSLSAGLSFLTATVGKAANFAEMSSFFTDSGYAIWFLYLIMIAESLGALGILLHFKLKTGPLAATGLMLIMIGALYTHRHNNDPFSDSYAALSQFITLFIMLFIYYCEREAAWQTVNNNNEVASKMVV
jgi:putative oxidoreductase